MDAQISPQAAGSKEVGNAVDNTVDTAAADRRTDTPPVIDYVIDYEGSRYRTEFWEGQSRQYEDAVERLILRELLPCVDTSPAHRPRRIAEIGAGFGRLADLYLDYDQIILFDYSRTLLQEAVERWGDDPRFVFVAGNVYDLPLATGSLDTLVMVRVMHHLLDVPRALSQLRRVLHRDSVAVVEYANKRNLKACLRWALGRQAWSPFDLAPLEFVELNFDFHPAWMQRRFEQERFRVERQAGVSHFRLSFLKRSVPAALLAKLDAQLFEIGGRFPLAPSVFVRLIPVDTGGNGTAGHVGSMHDDFAQDGSASELLDDAAQNAAENMQTQRLQPDVTESDVTEPGVPASDITTLFCCPRCFTEGSFTRPKPDRLVCGMCDAVYGQNAGIWDFKELL